ncbi:MAG TPA: ATP-binding protein [Myxococcaceae bacterium]|nr:ATP-binding protein [Myxococcaceae bacterium]
MSQPFDRLIIHQLRGLKELELTGFGQVNLLVGGNDSGKTTVLEALSLLSNPLDSGTWIRAAGRREPVLWVRRTTPLEQLRWLFPQHAHGPTNAPYEGTARFSAEGAYPVTIVHARYKEVEGIQLEEPKSGNQDAQQQGVEEGIERFGAEISVQAMRKKPGEPAAIAHEMNFTLWEHETIHYVRDQEEWVVPLRIINPHEHRISASFVSEFSDARISGFQESVRELVREIDPRITGLEILAPRGSPMLFLQDSVAGLAPLSAFGDGIRRALLMALAIPRLKGGVLLIDELETAIHVSALTKLFRWMLSACKQHNVQLFATTHSLEAVDAVLGVDTTAEEDIVGYRLERTEGRSVAKRFGEGMLKRLRYERGLDVR